MHGAGPRFAWTHDGCDASTCARRGARASYHSTLLPGSELAASDANCSAPNACSAGVMQIATPRAQQEVSSQQGVHPRRSSN
jgi:hypothetical protein